MPDANARIAALEAQVALLREQMDAMASNVGDLETTAREELGGLLGGDPVVWHYFDFADAGDEPDLVSMWSLPEFAERRQAPAS